MNVIGLASTFEQGRKYVARLHLVGAEAMFGSATDIARRLEAAGFSQLSVTGLPPAGAQRTDRFPDGATYWASGVYTRPTATVELPAQITDVWPGPAVRPAGALVIKAPAPTLKQTLRQPVQVPKWAVAAAIGYLLYLETKTPRRR